MELIKSIDPLLQHDCFIGRQPGDYKVNTGAGFGAISNHILIKIMMDDYNDIQFINAKTGEMDLYTCPQRNSKCLIDNGLKLENSYQEICNTAIYPSEYFSPLDVYTGIKRILDSTYSIHHCGASWNVNETKAKRGIRHIKYRFIAMIHFIVHIPNCILKFIIGADRYKLLKNRFRTHK